MGISGGFAISTAHLTAGTMPYASMGAAKRDFIEGGVTFCETCGWSPPECLVRAHANDLRLLHLHHVVPRIAGGDDSLHNLVMVCLRCHGVAHALWPSRNGVYQGPHVREALIQEMRAFLVDPEGWWSRRREASRTTTVWRVE